MGSDDKAGGRLNPFPAYHFSVEINGIAHPFKSVAGLKIEQSVVDLEEGGFNQTTRKLAGPVKSPPLVLKKGLVAGNSELMRLKKLNMNDGPEGSGNADGPGRGWITPDRFSGTITQLGPDGSNAKWFFGGGFISKWEGPDFDATKNEISIESIEISHNGLVLMGGAGPQFKSSPAPAPAPQSNNNTINFGSGSADPGSSAAVQSTANDLKNNPDKKVSVEGHTDNVGSASSNQTLSQQRADGVRQQLISGGAKPEQVTATGFGETQPIADNSTAAGRSQNRRVEIHDA